MSSLVLPLCSSLRLDTDRQMVVSTMNREVQFMDSTVDEEKWCTDSSVEENILSMRRNIGATGRVFLSI